MFLKFGGRPRTFTGVVVVGVGGVDIVAADDVEKIRSITWEDGSVVAAGAPTPSQATNGSSAPTTSSVSASPTGQEKHPWRPA